MNGSEAAATTGEALAAPEDPARLAVAAPPLIYRAMKVDSGRPMIGTSSMMLGARVPKDVAPDGDGNVHPGGGGMSVQPRLVDIPAMFLPRRLKHLNRNAAGNNNVVVFRMGEGPFARSAISEKLSLHPDEGRHPRHGVVEPLAPMRLDEYQSALERTRDQWVNGEP